MGIHKIWFVLMFSLVLLWPAGTEASGATRSQRQVRRAAIRQMEILDRPDRFGHVYGNTVRRIHRWQMRRLR